MGNLVQKLISNPVSVSSCMETEVDLQCLIYGHLIIQSGRVKESGNLVELTRDLLSGDKTLCPGIMEDFSDFGYVPKGLRVMDGAITTTHAKPCMIWHLTPQILVGDKFVASV